jgi:hypothetical protein
MDSPVCKKRQKGNNYWSITVDDTYADKKKHIHCLKREIAVQWFLSNGMRMRLQNGKHAGRATF